MCVRVCARVFVRVCVCVCDIIPAMIKWLVTSLDRIVCECVCDGDGLSKQCCSLLSFSSKLFLCSALLFYVLRAGHATLAIMYCVCACVRVCVNVCMCVHR